MKTTFTTDSTDAIRAQLKKANTSFNQAYPGDSFARQPVHTLYGGAQLFKSDSTKKIGELALHSFKQYAPSSAVLFKALGVTSPNEKFAQSVYQRVEEKLKREAVEDFRIDFEDGYGNRADSEEDGHAEAAAISVAEGMAAKTISPFVGIRIKPFTEELFNRSMRTLDIFVSTLTEKNLDQKASEKLPENFVITIPKVVIPEQVTALVRLLEILETKNKLSARSLKLELMIETPQSILSQKGSVTLSSLVGAAEGRCVGAHFGTYDYTASCNITAAYQYMAHAACDFAKHMMQVSLAGTGINISDGATNIMPVGPHRSADGKALSAEQIRENESVVHRAWKISYDHIRHSLENGFYQGWDLHPGQLPIRYAAVYAFFLESLEAASQRLKSFMDKAAQATLLGDVFDDAATGQGLLNFFLRGINCGAITEAEALSTGLTLEEIRGRSFYKILENRKKKHAK